MAAASNYTKGERTRGVKINSPQGKSRKESTWRKRGRNEEWLSRLPAALHRFSQTKPSRTSFDKVYIQPVVHKYTLKILVGLIQILLLLPITNIISLFTTRHEPPLPQCSSHKSGCPTGLQNLDVCYDNLPCGALVG